MRPKPPFLAWLHAADPTRISLTLADLGREPTIYLAPAWGNSEEERDGLQAVCQTIFVDQLDG